MKHIEANICGCFWTNDVHMVMHDLRGAGMAGIGLRGARAGRCLHDDYIYAILCVVLFKRPCPPPWGLTMLI